MQACSAATSGHMPCTCLRCSSTSPGRYCETPIAATKAELASSLGDCFLPRSKCLSCDHCPLRGIEQDLLLRAGTRPLEASSKINKAGPRDRGDRGCALKEAGDTTLHYQTIFF